VNIGRGTPVPPAAGSGRPRRRAREDAGYRRIRSHDAEACEAVVGAEAGTQVNGGGDGSSVLEMSMVNAAAVALLLRHTPLRRERVNEAGSASSNDITA
jgi:hypothetical protein